MDTIIYFSLAISYVILFIIGALLARRSGLADIGHVLLFVILALFYDNAVLAIGQYVGEGRTLYAISLPRYWLHAFITPLLVLFAWRTLVLARIRWASHRVAKWFFILLTIGLIIFDFVAEVWELKLKPVWENGVLVYEKAGASGPPLMIMGVMTVLLIASLIVWRKQKWPWYFIGIISMGLTPLINVFIKTDAAHNIFELLLMIALLSTKAYQDAHAR